MISYVLLNMSLATNLFGHAQTPAGDAGVAVLPPAVPAAAPVAPAPAPAPTDAPAAPAETAPATTPLDGTADPSPAPQPAPAYVHQDMSAPPAYPPAPAPANKSRFVFAFLPGPTYGLHFFPSANLPFFFGARLKRSPWALGFQFTVSGGLAERYLSGLFTHRYHITGLTSFGARGRGFASVGGGFAVRLFSPMVEAEGRVGLRFGSRRRGIVAGVVRLGYDFAHREGAPVPQVGVVVGICTF